jgi:uncharacterized protein (DUF169 family)
MDWQKWSDRLKKHLNLATDPVAVVFANGPMPGGAQAHGKVSVCQALKRASEGEILTISVETCGCAGGLVSLGLGQMPQQGKEKLVDFLVNKEKVYCSRMALHRSQQVVLAPVGAASHVVFCPLSKAIILPDLVALMGTPGSLHSVLGLAAYWEGSSILAELTGPACRTAITYPVLTGQIGLSLLDHGARRLARFGEDQVLVAIPFHRMMGIMEAVDRGVGAGRADDTATAERQIDELGGVEKV